MQATSTIQLGGSEYEVARFRLGGFLALTAAYGDIQKAVEQRDTGSIASGIFSYLQTAIPELTRAEFEACNWLEILSALFAIREINRIPDANKYSLLMSKGKSKSVPWEYPARIRYIWVHTIALTYHWSMEAIHNLWPEQAVAFIMEIIAHDHNERQFVRSLSEVSYEKKGNKMKLVDLPLPEWMAGNPNRPVKTELLRKDMLPVGDVQFDSSVPDDVKYLYPGYTEGTSDEAE